MLRQLSVFLENKKGRLSEITQILADAGIDIRASSIADTSDFGIFRLIVCDVDRAEALLREAGMTVSSSDVIGVGIEDRPGGLARAARLLADAGISVEYFYAFVSRSEDLAYVILRVEDCARAEAVLAAGGLRVVSREDIF